MVKQIFYVSTTNHLYRILHLSLQALILSKQKAVSEDLSMKMFFSFRLYSSLFSYYIIKFESNVLFDKLLLNI